MKRITNRNVLVLTTGASSLGGAWRSDPVRGSVPPPLNLIDISHWFPNRRVALRMVRSARARRFILRVTRDGKPQLTLPRWGSEREGVRFAERQAGWLERQLDRHQERQQSRHWGTGTEILFRGISCRIEAIPDRQHVVQIDGEVIEVGKGEGNVRLWVERHLRRVAQRELPQRTWELAVRHGCALRKVSVRNQRTRWGSCSRRGTVSLNWRLIQVPESVRDYLILHELMHLREMNHSPRFWREVEQVCPGYREAELWLKRHSSLLA